MKSNVTKVLHMPVRNAKGGITQYALRSWEHIDKSRFLFDWVTLDRELSFENELIRQGCKVHHLSCRQEDNESLFRAEMEAILSYGYDAAHLHTSFWRGFLAEELAISAGIPKIIVHAHSTGIDISDETERSKLLTAHDMWKTRFNVGLATHFTACSVPASEFLFGAQIPKERIRILRNAIDTDIFAFNEGKRSSTRIQMDLDENFVILQPARLEHQKNHSFTLKYFAEVVDNVPKAILLFAGDGSLRGDIESEARGLGIHDSVFFLGFRSDIPDLIQVADLLVMPSLFEGLSIAAIEAQCSGVMCLLSDQMAEETVISDNAERLPLLKDLWIEKTVKLALDGYERRDRSYEIATAGYSLKEQIKILEKYYIGEDQ